MKHIIFALLLTGSVAAQERVSLTVDGDTGALCYQLINQVNLSAQDPKLVEAAQKLAAAKADIEKAVKVSQEPKKK